MLQARKNLFNYYFLNMKIIISLLYLQFKLHIKIFTIYNLKLYTLPLKPLKILIMLNSFIKQLYFYYFIYFILRIFQKTIQGF